MSAFCALPTTFPIKLESRSNTGQDLCVSHAAERTPKFRAFPELRCGVLVDQGHWMRKSTSASNLVTFRALNSEI